MTHGTTGIRIKEKMSDADIRNLQHRFLTTKEPGLLQKLAHLKRRQHIELTLFEEIADIENVPQERLLWIRNFIYRIRWNKKLRKHYADTRLQDYCWLDRCSVFLKSEWLRRKGGTT